jgi:hypothetical protein
MADKEQDIASLISRIERLENGLNVRKQNITWLKHYFDELKQQFDTRPELQQIAQLSEQVACLQQRHEFTPPIIPPSSESVVGTSDSLLDANVFETEQDEKIDPSAQQGRKVTVFSDEKFKVAKMTLLLGYFGDMLLIEAYLSEEKSQEKPISAEEFLKRYNEGTKRFYWY